MTCLLVTLDKILLTLALAVGVVASTCPSDSDSVDLDLFQRGYFKKNE